MQTVKKGRYIGRDAMKGRSPFIFIPQNRLCRFEERLESRFLCHFLPVMRSMTRK